MKVETKQMIIIRLTPNEAAWLKEELPAAPPSSEEHPNRQKMRTKLREALDELNY